MASHKLIKYGQGNQIVAYEHSKIAYIWLMHSMLLLVRLVSEIRV
jgi:hypothetical protein